MRTGNSLIRSTRMRLVGSVACHWSRVIAVLAVMTAASRVCSMRCFTRRRRALTLHSRGRCRRPRTPRTVGLQ